MSKRKLTVVLYCVLCLCLFSCGSDDNGGKESIIGKWNLYQSHYYHLSSLEFTNYGIMILRAPRFIDSKFDYSYDGDKLTIGSYTGKAQIKGEELIISGFNNPSSYGAEGVTGPCINGRYIKENKQK